MKQVEGESSYFSGCFSYFSGLKRSGHGRPPRTRALSPGGKLLLGSGGNFLSVPAAYFMPRSGPAVEIRSKFDAEFLTSLPHLESISSSELRSELKPISQRKVIDVVASSSPRPPLWDFWTQLLQALRMYDMFKA